ncbi:unnamed protein product [Discula destructiva]
MSTVAPYWGDLPGSQAATQPKQHSSSGDHASSAPRRQSLDTAPAGAPHSKSNRVSAQTNVTEPQTESSLSPYASPRSSYQDYGLAPRPTPQSNYPPDLAERRRRRASRYREEEDAYMVSGALPVAPEAPKGPPLSFRHPYGNGGLPYTLPKVGDPQQPDIPPSPGIMDPEPYKPLAADRSKRASTNSNRRSSSGSTVPARNGSANGYRKSSLGNELDNRLFANTRSPLQILELTLDSITKEEKRKRLEAAERDARERAPRGAAQDGTHTPTVRFKDRDEVSEVDTPRTQITAEPVSAPSSGGTPKRVRLEDPQQRKPQRETPQSRSRPEPRKAVPVAHANETSIPTRNLSFRERAAQNDTQRPNGEPYPAPSPTPTPTPPLTTPTRGLSLTRNGSNKLRKEPAGDPWYSRRSEAEKKSGQISTGERGVYRDSNEARGFAATPAAVGPNPPNKAGGASLRNKVPALNTAVTRRQPGRGATFDDDLESPITTGYSTTAAHAARQGQGSGPTKAPSHSPFPFVSDRPQNATSEGKVTVGAARGAAALAGTAAFAGSSQHNGNVSDGESDHEGHFSEMFRRQDYKPGQGLYNPPKYLAEWRKGTVGTLSGAILDLTDEMSPTSLEKRSTSWESPPSPRRSSTSRPRKAEAFDGEYDETNAPTRFKPPLYLKCGPLLRYCGMRHERIPSRSARKGPSVERVFWRGSVMIVTADDESSYDIAPTLRIFAQPLELLPPPPAEVHGALPPEYEDPIAGHPKLGRRGDTQYVRPVHHLELGKDSSRGTSDGDLFEKTRSPPDVGLPEGSTDVPGSFIDRKSHSSRDGEKMGKFKDVRGYRLHAERGYTFWRFSLEVELREKEQRIAYRINRGPATGFWVPAKGQSMNIMFHSCNGFSMSVNPDELSGPDPMWRDVLNSHQSRPFHVMLGGGDQIYCDAVMRQTKHFQDWLMMRNPLHKHNAPFTMEMQDELESFYLERYCMWFSQGLFGLANSQIPMVNMYDDHDIIDGFGSYPDHFMKSPVFSGLGNVAFKYYMLFQQQSISEETEETEPSWVLGHKPGPYIHELSRSLFMHLGSKIALLAVDCRTERMRDQVMRLETWDKLIDRCYAEIVKGKTEHLLVLLGVPIAYPRLVWLENILTSRLLDPIKALGKTGLFGNVFNKFDGGVEVLDDLDDHWTAKNHKAERKLVVEDLQDLAADRSLRVTILSGDVHLAAVGQFYSNPKLELAKHKDFRYMPNVISSAIVNTPPPDLMADVLNKRNKVHHLDKDTDEDMIPLFAEGVEGQPRNNKRLLPHRNWCSIREYTPGNTPPSTPSASLYDSDAPVHNSSGHNGALFDNGTPRRLFKQNRGPSYRADVIDSRPPISTKGPGGMFRTLSSRGRRSDSDVEASSKRPSTAKRTLSLTRGDFSLFRGRSKTRRPDDGGINGTWADEDDNNNDNNNMGSDSEQYDARGRAGFLGAIGLRGGGGHQSGEFSDDGESYFTTRAPANVAVTPRSGPGPSTSKTARLLGEEAPPATNSRGLQSPTFRGGPGYGTTTTGSAGQQQQQPRPINNEFRPRTFNRTPTGASAKQLKRTKTWDVNIEGGLDITLNVEVSAQDPAGITAPYRLLVPKLFYDVADGGAVELPAKSKGSVKRLLSLNRGGSSKGKARAASVGPARGDERDASAVASGANGNGNGREDDTHAVPGTAI